MWLLSAEHEALFGLSDEAELQRQLQAGVLLRNERACSLLGGGGPQQWAHGEDGATVAPEAAAQREEASDAAAGGETSEASTDDEDADSSCDDDEYAQLREAAYARRELRRQQTVDAGHSLNTDGVAIVDGLLGAPAIDNLLRGVLELHGSDASPFVAGKTGGGPNGGGQKYAESVVRGDHIAVLGDGEESRVPGLDALLRRADEFVEGMARAAVPALRRVTSRSRPMLACYPGNGARYVRHLDNPGGERSNGRLLTLLVYLNAEWQPEDGGMLRIHRADGSSVDIEPLLDRAVVFWSDARTPHEVLPAQRPRWA
eukprot:3836251-Prymnesium_polylepis.1